MTAGRVAAILCLISSAGCVAVARREPDASVARTARSGERLPLVVELASDKAEYVIGEAITFTVTISNPGAEAVTYFDEPDILGFWNPGDFDLLDFSPAQESMWQGDPPNQWFAEPDGTRNHIVGRIPVGWISENTEPTAFVTIPSGSDLGRTRTMPAKVTGRWKVAAQLDSRQNFHIRDHYPYPSGSYRYVPKTPEEAARRAAAAERARIAQVKRERDLEAQGWRWNEEREWRERVEPGAALGTAWSNEIEIIVREAD